MEPSVDTFRLKFWLYWSVIKLIVDLAATCLLAYPIVLSCSENEFIGILRIAFWADALIMIADYGLYDIETGHNDYVTSPARLLVGGYVLITFLMPLTDGKRTEALYNFFQGMLNCIAVDIFILIRYIKKHFVREEEEADKEA